MKIAVFAPKTYGGTGLYRLYMPHELLAARGHSVVFCDSTKPDYYRDFDIFIASKSWFAHANHMIGKLNSWGIATIIDFDDYWALPQSHYLYVQYKKYGTTNILVEALRNYRFVTCTTELLASEVQKINKNVAVFENALDPRMPQFSLHKTESESLRFGWIGGHCHLPDISLLDGTPQSLTGAFQIHLFGHDRQHGGVYDRFADILSGMGKIFDPDPNKTKFFVHAQTDSRKYTQFYNFIDVALAPLVGDKFNSMKSELKVVEAGFMRKALIVSNVNPYKPLLTRKNSMIVDSKQHWRKYMQKLINSPALCEDMAEHLYETVKRKFDLHAVTLRREQWYESIIKK